MPIQASKVSDLEDLDISISIFLDHRSIFKEKRSLSTGIVEMFCNTILALHRNIPAKWIFSAARRSNTGTGIFELRQLRMTH